jgi:RNA polymerase sigma-70 factor (TIGR02960 family)
MSRSGVVGGNTGPEFRPDRNEFEDLVEPLVPALRLHCYRLLGSLEDAEDTVQETLIRGWRRLDRLADPSGIRPWLFRIATNASLDLIDRRRRRPTARLVEETDWPDPLPDHWLGGGGDPANGLLRRESVGLAFIAAVQLLPPRQRAILVLRDVLDWSVRDVAEALETTPAAVNSGLQRARVAIRERLPADGPASFSTAAPDDARDVARRYLDAWERADMTSLARLLAVDARMAMPPDPRSFQGRSAIVGYLQTAIFSVPAGQRISLQPTVASGQPAFVVRQPDETTGQPQRIGLMVLTVQRGRIAEIRGYMRAELAERFG